MRRMIPTTRSHRSRRTGAVIVEGALVLGVFLTILLASLDLSLAVLIDNTLADGARRLARAAIVRGEGSAGLTTPWGPTSFMGSADGNTEFADAIRQILVAVDPADVQIAVDWPDGGNGEGDRVEVTLTSEYQAIFASLLGADPYLLQATSTMRIEP